MNALTEVSQAAVPVRPQHINTLRHFWDSFGRAETEISARWLVRFAQQRNSWASFSRAELESFYHTERPRDEAFLFNGLTPDYIVQTGNRFQFTTEFIARCYDASPKVP